MTAHMPDATSQSSRSLNSMWVVFDYLRANFEVVLSMLGKLQQWIVGVFVLYDLIF